MEVGCVDQGVAGQLTTEAEPGAGELVWCARKAFYGPAKGEAGVCVSDEVGCCINDIRGSAYGLLR